MSRKLLGPALAAVLMNLSAVAGAAGPPQTAVVGPPPLPAMVQWHSTDSGVKYAEIVVGKGASPHDGQTAVVHFTGWLDDGTRFDSSRDRKQPFGFRLGSGQVIIGWDEGVRGMRVGGQRRLIVPPSAGYGHTGINGLVPPDARLTFDIELLAIVDK
jgi:peptidylprolyl isomerase